MIEKIEQLESLMNTKPSQSVIDGFACIEITLSIIKTGNEDLIKALQNGRNTSI